MNVIEQLEAEQMKKLTGDKTYPEFAPGDTLKVNVKVVEGARERLQAFEGVGKSARIAEKTDGYAAKVTAREKAAAAERKSRADAKARGPGGARRVETSASEA